MEKSMVIYPQCEKTDELYFHKKDDKEYPIVHVLIEGEKRQYYFKRQCYQDCHKCNTLKLKFGWNPNNNCLSAYCYFCGFKYPKGLSQVKNGNKRNSEHSYFGDHQKDIERYFCEICFASDNLNIHHIVEVRAGGTHEPDNLQLLCKHCHNMVHSVRHIAGV